MRRLSTSSVAFSQTEMPLARIAARVSAFMKAPPPVASTCGPLSSSRAITRASPARKYGSPCAAKISGMVMPAAFSISVSASTNGMPSRAASRRPIDDLPAPIMPTSTTERRPSAGPSSGRPQAAPRSASPHWAALCVTMSDMLYLYRKPARGINRDLKMVNAADSGGFRRAIMPSLFRFLLVVGLLGGLGYAGVFCARHIRRAPAARDHRQRSRPTSS